MFDHVLDAASGCFFDLLVVLGDVHEDFGGGPLAAGRCDQVRFILVGERGFESLVDGAKAAAVRLPGVEVLDQALLGAADVFEEALGFGAQVHFLAAIPPPNSPDASARCARPSPDPSLKGRETSRLNSTRCRFRMIV